MAKLTKNAIDADLRTRVFAMIANGEIEAFQKINERQYGCILIDKNGVERYCRIGVIVAEEREDMTARKLMQSEIDAYNAKQIEKAEKAKAKAEKAARDKEARAKKTKEEKGE